MTTLPEHIAALRAALQTGHVEGGCVFGATPLAIRALLDALDEARRDAERLREILQRVSKAHKRANSGAAFAIAYDKLAPAVDAALTTTGA